MDHQRVIIVYKAAVCGVTHKLMLHGLLSEFR